MIPRRDSQVHVQRSFNTNGADCPSYDATRPTNGTAATESATTTNDDATATNDGTTTAAAPCNGRANDEFLKSSSMANKFN